MLVLSLAGIAGAWIVRAQLATDLVDIATEAEARATTAKRGLDRLDAALSRTHDQVTGVERDVQALGADLEQNRPLLDAITDKVGVEIGIVSVLCALECFQGAVFECVRGGCDYAL